MNLANLVGQTLDEKYRIERELGKGGMGAVYLATHIGTERPVAVKVIVPQFMKRREFVERFKREARAAGRLRHPNVVDVTDFGFGETSQGRVAYLVMEYLDGCTLGEVLEEERQLPLEWSLDILEQISSAIQEAHEQGIIHRDLKPDNIWLEPNQRGGYTVKVLDFGIAKLEENMDEATSAVGALTGTPVVQTPPEMQNSTVVEKDQDGTLAENRLSTVAGDAALGAQTKIIAAQEAGTLLQPAAEIDLESGTAILPSKEKNTVGRETVGTRLMSAQMSTEEEAFIKKSTSELTRVGAVLGTPLYMSPEQCRGERLTPRSDIYSLGVIAYQMLSGRTPFEGDFKAVMNAHINMEPPPLNARKVPRKVKEVIMKALAKDPADRPQSAEAFSSALRAHAEGIGILLRKALVIYGEHLPKFLWLSFLIFSPVILVTLLQTIFTILTVSGVISGTVGGIVQSFLGLLSGFFGILSGYMMIGMVTWIVTQLLAVPLRPVDLKTAFAAARRRWKTFAGTGMLTAVLNIVGYVLCIVPGLIVSVLWALVAPVIMMEHLRGRAALRRSKELVRRAILTTTAAVFIMFIVPAILSGISALAVNSLFQENKPVAETSSEPKEDTDSAQSENVAARVSEETQTKSENETEFSIKSAQSGFSVKFDDGDNMRSRVRAAVRDAVFQILWAPLQILLSSFSGIVIALLYLKTRQAGGESVYELLKQFEDDECPRSNWQMRVRQRLIQSGKITSRP